MTKDDCIRKITHKDGSESWHYEVRIRGHAVRGTCTTKSDAKNMRDQIRSDIKRGAYLHTAEAQRCTVGDLIDKFSEHCLSRYGNYQSKMRAHLFWWQQELGRIRLSDIAPGKIVECQNKLYGAKTYRKTPRSGACVNRYTASLSRVFRHGITLGWLQSNPMSRVSKLKEGPSRNRFLSREEIESLFKACESSPNQNLLPIVKIAALTGMRLGEIIGLKTKSIDFARKIICLEHTKNGEKRLIPISSVLEEVLKGYLITDAPPDEYVFKTRRRSTKNRIGMIRTAFAKALKESGIEGAVFHDLRRTFCSHAGMARCTQMELQEMLGHRSATMTKIYLKYSQSHIADQMERAQGKILQGTTHAVL